MTESTATILFTNVRDSTALFERAGNRAAYDALRSHFTVLRNAIEQQGGRVIKTVGDGVMAVFDAPSTAVRAVLRAHELMAADMDGIQPVHMKAGVHVGDCLIVDIDQREDYIGAAVNIAAQLARAGDGGDVVISADAFRDTGITDTAQRHELNVVTNEMLVKGSTMPLRYHKLRPARATWSRC
jgi:class 3 adenylate cyclase